MEKPIIKVENLTKIFKLKQKQQGLIGSLSSVFRPHYKLVKAVDQINFEVKAGEILAFIGPNGAGKSTTIKMLTGLIYPTSGRLEVLGFNPSKQRSKLAFHVGTVFGQKPQLWYHLPPQETFTLLEKIYELDHGKFKQRLKMLVETFELEELLKTPVRKLSLGQRMRCEIAASFLHSPEIIFLDEPTIGLDVIARQRIREVLLRLNREENVTIFLTSHDAGDIEALAQRTIVINHGQVVFDDSTEKLKKTFIRKKIVEIVTEQEIGEFEFHGGTVLSKGQFDLKIELDTSKNGIQKLLDYTIKQYAPKDINIYDPPMEEIIAGIYQNKNYAPKL